MHDNDRELPQETCELVFKAKIKFLSFTQQDKECSVNFFLNQEGLFLTSLNSSDNFVTFSLS